MSDVELSRSQLVTELDPARDYGSRSFEEVVRGVEEGSIEIREGVNLPVLRDASTGRAIKGTGREPVGDEDHPSWSRRRFQERAVEDFDEVYGAIVDSALSGDVRAQKLFLEYSVGRAREMSGSDMPELVKALLAAGAAVGQSTRLLRSGDFEVEDVIDE